jgi:ribosome-binding factor A
MTGGARPNRVSEEFREILAEEIPRLKDPRIGFVTVVGVRVTPDLRRARVFYTTMGDERARRATAAALRSARGHLRKVIGDQVRMKVLPDLEFEEDMSVQTTDRIEQLLQQVRQPDEGSGGTISWRRRRRRSARPNPSRSPVT